MPRDLLMHQFASRPKGSAPSHRGLWWQLVAWTARVQEAEQRPLRCSMLALIEPGTEAASPFNDPLLQNRRVSEYLSQPSGI